MPRRSASVTQADVARIIHAAKQAGAIEVVVKIGEESIVVRLTSSTPDESPLASSQEIVL
jgi:hypothetical protein